MPYNTDRIRLWFDPSCPWAWLTYRWLRQTQTAGRDFTLDLAVMSLAILNEHSPDAPERYKYPHARSLQLGRVLIAATETLPDETSSNEILTRMYDSLGHYIHHTGGRDYDHANRQALTAADLPTAIADAANTTTYDAILRQQTTRSMAVVGPGVGTPVIEIGDTAYFGPILSRIPNPDDAIRLFDAITTLATHPHFYELKRHRTEEPTFT
ncbi:hypothetical protein TPB0596_10160 [Tsukamurella pulmonis]|nr:hypothetical protein TPB0596_10160 [Tsukamurella pulmonis]